MTPSAQSRGRLRPGKPAPLLADGVRRGLLVGEATDPERPDSPGLVVIAGDGAVEALSPGAHEWFDRLPNDHGHRHGVPTSVLAVAAGALADRRARGAAGFSTARVRTADGAWAAVHGTVMDGTSGPSVTVIIESAHPDRIAPLLMSIFDLTDREQEVTQLVLRGSSTAELARQLDVSPHTVQQHLKRIFEKTEVHSRGELVARIYLECHDRRARDNRDRIRSERSIRGGPKAP